jgi:hypothetical protein
MEGISGYLPLKVRSFRIEFPGTISHVTPHGNA